MTGKLPSALLLRAFLLVLLLCILSLPLRSQVRTYPLYYISQKGTYGTYRDAEQKKIFHLSTDVSIVPTWNRTISFLYRRSQIDYSKGFVYKQNQVTGSYSQVFSAGDDFLWTRLDLTYVNSNADLTNKNFTLYAESGYKSSGGRAGLGFGGFYSNYVDVRSFAASIFVWTQFSGQSYLSSKFNFNTFSGNLHDQKKFYSGSLSFYLPSSDKVAFLFSGIIGKRSLFYDSDIKLLYNTSDIHLLGGSGTIFLYPTPSLIVFLDKTFASYEAFRGGKYRVFYFTLGGILTI